MCRKGGSIHFLSAPPLLTVVKAHLFVSLHDNSLPRRRLSLERSGMRLMALSVEAAGLPFWGEWTLYFARHSSSSRYKRMQLRPIVVLCDFCSDGCALIFFLPRGLLIFCQITPTDFLNMLICNGIALDA